jgi:aminopeptidase N
MMSAISAERPHASASTGRDHYTADQPADILHMRLQMTFTADGLVARTCEGVVEYTFQPRTQELAALRLDAVGMKILRVTMGEKELQHSYDDKALTIEFADPIVGSATGKVSIAYRIEDPPKGMHFVLPNQSAPSRQTMAYTMSEPIEARYWVPTHDWPNERWTSDILITVPPTFTAVANGLLVDKKESPGSVVFHWRNDTPIDPHLMGFAIGELVELTNTWRGKPIDVFTQSGSEAAARFTFERVPQMLDFFTGLLGVDFPFAGYNHVTVVEHHHGGMEHAGFSFVMPGVLSENENGAWPREHAESWLIAHMMAHQWFGGMVNYRSVSQAWLNEGFGTYLDTLWTAHTDAPARVAWNMDRYARTIAASDSSETGKPMVRRDLEELEDIYSFDGGKIYVKGAWVLHMLRLQLGEALFWSAVKDYLLENNGKSVETLDLRRAFEKASGRDLEQFFQQWVYGHGIPRLEVDYSWDSSKRNAKVVVRQTQKVDTATPAFVFPLELVFRAKGKSHTNVVDIDQAREDFAFPFSAQPNLLAVDPRGAVLKTLKVNAPEALILEQTRNGPTPLSCWAAIRSLTNSGTDTLAALEASLRDNNAYWGVRDAAAAALGRVQTDAALAVLLRAATNASSHPRVLAAIIEALGSYTVSVDAHETVLRYAGPEQPLYVQHAAVTALGGLRASPELRQKSREQLARALEPNSRRYVRTAALRALRRMDDPESYNTVLALTKPGLDPDIRNQAITLLGRLGRLLDSRDETRNRLTEWLSDPDRGAQAAAATGLGELKDPRAIADLERINTSARVEGVRTAAREAIESIKRPDDPKASMAAVLDRLTALEKRNQELEKQIKALTPARPQRSRSR